MTTPTATAAPNDHRNGGGMHHRQRKASMNQPTTSSSHQPNSSSPDQPLEGATPLPLHHNATTTSPHHHNTPSPRNKKGNRRRRRKRSRTSTASTLLWCGQSSCLALALLYLVRVHRFLRLGGSHVGTASTLQQQDLRPASAVSLEEQHRRAEVSPDRHRESSQEHILSDQDDLQQSPQQQQPLLRASQKALHDIGLQHAPDGAHQHVIPNHLSFTHYLNFLQDGILDDLPEPKDLAEEWEQVELRALRDNVHAIVDLHPGTTPHFYTDDDCLAAMRTLRLEKDDTDATTEYDDDELSELLVRSFTNESTGMYKADLCRGVALYETGGLYTDVDLGVRMNLWEALRPETTFATAKVHMASQHLGCFFQAFMAVTARHPIIKRYITLFVEYYEGKLTDLEKGPLGVLLLRRAYDEVLLQQPELGDTVELWQEVFYHPEYQRDVFRHVPPPVWGGEKRACHFVVVSDRDVDPITVPLYSRIANSRMCPAMPQGDFGIYTSMEQEEEDREPETPQYMFDDGVVA